MGRATVRAAITAFFEAQSIPHLAAVYRSRPTEIVETAYDLDLDTSPSGAVMIVHIANDDDVREALTGQGNPVGRIDTHATSLEIKFQSVNPSAEEAQDDHDDLIDAIKQAIRSDQTLGCGYDPSTNTPNGPIWQAGEGAFGIKFTMAQPLLDEDGLTLQINCLVSFQTKEWTTTTA